MERNSGRHVGIAPQCAFNSYVWRSRVRDWWRLVYMPHTILLGLYRPGAMCDTQVISDPSPACSVSMVDGPSTLNSFEHPSAAAAQVLSESPRR